MATHARHPSLPQQPVMDTPTPASSSGHNSAIMTSIKQASRRNNNNNNNVQSKLAHEYNKYSNNTTARPPLSSANIRLSTLLHPSNAANFDQLQDYDLSRLDIGTDGTERERRTLEEEIRRGMGQLEQRTASSSSDSDVNSVGFGDLSDVELYGGGRATTAAAAGRAQDLRAKIRDESATEEDDDDDDEDDGEDESSESLGDDFSLRIGMAGTRNSPSAAVGPALGSNSQPTAPAHEQDTNDLTYLSISRSASPDSPARHVPPQHQTSTSPATAAAALATALGREYERAKQQQQQQQQRQPNSVPVPAAALKAHAPRLAPFPPRKTSPVVKSKSVSTTVPLPSQSRAQQQQRQHADKENVRTEPETETGATPRSRLRLPDVTGLTEGLTSPQKTRAVGRGGGGTAFRSTKVDLKGNERAQTKRDEDGAVLSSALDQLRHRLASLEQDNAASHGRVRELETKLARERAKDQLHHHQQQQRARDDDVTQRHEREGWEEKLGEERERREALETLVQRLKSQIMQLTQSLSSHSATLAALRQAPSAARATAAPSIPSQDRALVTEVAALRSGLDHLGEEVDVVKHVVNELVEERDAARLWEREEEERRRVLERAGRESGTTRRDFVEDPDRTPRAPQRFHHGQDHEFASGDAESVPDTPRSSRSFINAAEIERLQAELAREQARRSPAPAPASAPAPLQRQSVPAPEPRRASKQVRHQQGHERPSIRTHHAQHPPARPRTAPLPSSHRHAQHHQQHPSRRERFDQHHRSAPPAPQSQPSSYSNSNGDENEDAEAYSSTTSYPANDDHDDMQRDFRRAEEIFRSVSGSGPGPAPEQKRGQGKDTLCTVCRRRRRSAVGDGEATYQKASQQQPTDKGKGTAAQRRSSSPRVDPRQALENVLADLEADFDVHKNIYVELSEQYRAMDSKAGGAKRRALADHLKESIDTLEMKADQVKRLHDLLHE